MKQLPKRPRLRLDPHAYGRLRQQVLERDGWRCQQCGRRANLEVHHVQRRSQQGDDTLDNLTTLCRICHDALHRYSINNVARSFRDGRWSNRSGQTVARARRSALR